METQLPPEIWWQRCCYYPHFTCKSTETQRKTRPIHNTTNLEVWETIWSFFCFFLFQVFNHFPSNNRPLQKPIYLCNMLFLQHIKSQFNIELNWFITLFNTMLVSMNMCYIISTFYKTHAQGIINCWRKLLNISTTAKTLLSVGVLFTGHEGL